MSVLPSGPPGLLREWQDADAALWGATEEGFEAALKRFCDATDAVVAYSDGARRHDLSAEIAGYKEELHAARDRGAGVRYSSFVDCLRWLLQETTRPRRRCLGALARLTNIAQPEPSHGAQQQQTKSTAAKPHWDEKTRELRFEGTCLKRFKQRAENQTKILDAFQAAGWPASIANPVEADEDKDSPIAAARRACDAIYKLNKCTSPIFFEQDGTGERIIWRQAHHSDETAT
jgi:hypothetical protein